MDVNSVNDLYKEIETILLLDEDIEFCCKLLLKLTFNLDSECWIQEICLRIILSDRDENLCGLAITCLGHLARIHKTINKDKVIPLLNLLKSENKYLSKIDDAIDDINDFT
ncbi:hypothetical protein AGMMS50239_37270 [Bacteroidia bacterium]|nr:hypothetical protein AGMMS50239_37270 [Bacteroidia bacterium]